MGVFVGHGGLGVSEAGGGHGLEIVEGFVPAFACLGVLDLIGGHHVFGLGAVGHGLTDRDAFHADGVDDLRPPFCFFIPEGASGGFECGFEACHGGAGGLFVGLDDCFGLIDQFGVADLADAAVFGAPGEEVFEEVDGGWCGVCAHGVW